MMVFVVLRRIRSAIAVNCGYCKVEGGGDLYAGGLRSRWVCECGRERSWTVDITYLGNWAMSSRWVGGVGLTPYCEVSCRARYLLRVKVPHQDLLSSCQDSSIPGLSIPTFNTRLD